MRLNAMLLILLNLLFHCELLRCDEFNSANFNVPPQRRHEYTVKRYEHFMNHAITEVLVTSTPRTDQTVHITAESSFLTTTLGNETYTQNNPPLLLSPSSPFAKGSRVSTSPKVTPIHSLASGLTTSANSLPVFRHLIDSPVKLSTHIPSSSGSISKGSSYLYHNIARSHVSASNESKSCPGSVSYPASTPPIKVDPSVAEVAKKWLHGLASPITTTPKMRIPKLTLIFDYDFETHQRFPHGIRRNQKNQRKKSSIQLERKEITKPQKSESSHPEPEAPSKTFWHNPPKELGFHSTKRKLTVMIPTKQRLNPDLLLGRATISVVKNKEDVGEIEESTSGSVESKWILRMHKIIEVTKKEWYSDRTVKESKRTRKESKRTETETPATKKLMLRQILAVTPTTTPVVDTASTTTIIFTTEEEMRQETYLIVFIIELTRLIATKEEKAVHDVVKHTDQILRSFYKNRQLQWVSQPLIDFTKQVAKSLKDSEIGVIQMQATDLYHMLRQRREMLSKEVNMILDYADRLYSDEEGEQLLKVLSEFAAFPNTTLNGYWLCNSLINTFVKPYRRLTDATERQSLMDAMKLALRTRYTPNGTKETNVLRNSGVRQAGDPPEEAVIRKEASIITTRAPRVRKRKRRHRSHKRKRGRKRHRLQRTKPQTEYTYNLMLRNVTPRTGEQPT